MQEGSWNLSARQPRSLLTSSGMPRFWLPPELWRIIFDFATYFKGEFDVYEWIQRSKRTENLDLDAIELELARLDTPSGHSNTFLLLNDPHFIDQRSLRLNLVKVCRDWYEINIERLYRSIVFRGATKIPGCVKLLQRKPSLGAVVRRLEFLEDDEDLEGLTLVDVRRLASPLIQLCPNLLIFSGTVEVNEAASFHLQQVDVPLRAWLASHCSKLEHTMGHMILDGFPASFFFRYINGFTNLRALQLPPHISTMPAREKPHVSLPHLRFLDIGNQIPLIPVEFGSYLARWELPSLDTVHLGTVTREISLQPFWTNHGKKLKTIKIYNSHESFIGRRLQEANLDINVPSSTLFPNLRQLIVLHNAPSHFINLFLPSTSLEIYEITLTGTWPANPDLVLHLITQLDTQHLAYLGPNVSLRSPGLKHVRISQYPQDADAVGGDRTGIYEELERVCRRWGQKFHQRNVTFEKIYQED